MAETRRQNNGQRCRIIQGFVRNIENDIERLVCFLFMRNFSNRQVCAQLGISRRRLKQIKSKLSDALVSAGIRKPEE